MQRIEIEKALEALGSYMWDEPGEITEYRLELLRQLDGPRKPLKKCETCGAFCPAQVDNCEQRVEKS